MITYFSFSKFLIEKIKMQVENDPNVIHGGDTDELGPLNENCASLGELILKNLKQGGDRKAFVSSILNST